MIAKNVIYYLISKVHSLNIKKKIHNIEKPFSCSMCGNRFTNNSHFKGHMKKHTGDIAIGSTQQGERTASSLISVNSSGTFPDKPFDNNDNNDNKDPFPNNQNDNEMKTLVEDSQLYDVGEISNSAEFDKQKRRVQFYLIILWYSGMTLFWSLNRSTLTYLMFILNINLALYFLNIYVIIYLINVLM